MPCQKNAGLLDQRRTYAIFASNFSGLWATLNGISYSSMPTSFRQYLLQSWHIEFYARAHHRAMQIFHFAFAAACMQVNVKGRHLVAASGPAARPSRGFDNHNGNVVAKAKHGQVLPGRSNT